MNFSASPILSVHSHTHHSLEWRGILGIFYNIIYIIIIKKVKHMLEKVRVQLRQLHPRKAAGPSKVCPQLLKTKPLQCIFNLTMQPGKVLTLWKTSCIVPVLNIGVVLPQLLKPQVQHIQDCLHTRQDSVWRMSSSTCFIKHTLIWMREMAL